MGLILPFGHCLYFVLHTVTICIHNPYKCFDRGVGNRMMYRDKNASSALLINEVQDDTISSNKINTNIKVWRVLIGTSRTTPR